MLVGPAHRATRPQPAGPSWPGLAARGLLCVAAVLPLAASAQGPAAPERAAPAGVQHAALTASTVEHGAVDDAARRDSAASAATADAGAGWRRWGWRALALGVGAGFGWALLRLGSGNAARRAKAGRQDRP